MAEPEVVDGWTIALGTGGFYAETSVGEYVEISAKDPAKLLIKAARDNDYYVEVPLAVIDRLRALEAEERP